MDLDTPACLDSSSKDKALVCRKLAKVCPTLGGAALGVRGWFMGRSIQKRQAKGLTKVDSFEILRFHSIYRT
jgi:hypothetical protein